jgi:hypothetical protein
LAEILALSALFAGLQTVANHDLFLGARAIIPFVVEIGYDEGGVVGKRLCLRHFSSHGLRGVATRRGTSLFLREILPNAVLQLLSTTRISLALGYLGG